MYPKPFRPGASLGEPANPVLQMRILRDALSLLRYPAEPGSVITREYGQE
jgi:hypothetical protein